MAQSHDLGISDGVNRQVASGARVPAALFATNVIVGLNFLVSVVSDGPVVWLSFVFYFAISIFLDELVGPRNRDSFAGDGEAQTGLYEWVIYGVAAVVIATFSAFLIVMSRTEFLSLNWVMRVLSLGLCLGILGIPIAHELGHRRHPVSRAAAAVFTALLWQPHFEVTHNMSHHRWVATTNDTATALYNENLYAFIVRSYLGGWVDALKIERHRLRHRAPLRRVLDHRVFRRTFGYGVFSALLLVVFPAHVVFGWLLACVFAAALMEVFNYISHYGLLRKRVGNGYERVGQQHVWSTDYLTARISMIELPYHADHHVHSRKRFYDLCNHDSPQLPASYQALYLLALVPPLWFAVMNPIVRRHWKVIGLTEADRQVTVDSDERRLFGFTGVEEP